MRQEDFVKEVMKATGLTQTELGDAMNLRNPYSKVHDWTTGKGSLRFEDTIALLELAGWVSIPATVADPDEVFATAMLGRMARLLEREPTLVARHGPLLRSLAEELRRFAGRLDEAAEANPNGVSLP